MISSSDASFPFRWALLIALSIGAVYFLPQLFYLRDWHAPQVLLEENYDEIAYAVWASRAAGEHITQPDPHQFDPQSTIPFSFATVQFFPAWVIGQLARITRLPVIILFLLGSFILPAMTGFFFAYLAWFCGAREPSSIMLCTVFSLLMLPPVLWLMQARYMATLLTGFDPGFHLSLPYSRRYQPQFTAVIHYFTIAVSLALLKLNRLNFCRSASVLAGIGFGISFYCYYFSWTILLGWFVLGALVVRWQYPEKLKVWLLAILLGLIIALPYFSAVIKNFSQISQSAASAHTRSWPADPAIWIGLMISAALLGVIVYDRQQRLALWPLLVLNLVITLGALQNVLTGIFIQPYHYLHYFGRPALNLALVAFCLVIAQRWEREARTARIVRNLRRVAIGLCLIIAVAFQYARYREVFALGREAVMAQGAMQAIRQHIPAGALVYCPNELAREAIPLYTNATAYFSRYMWLSETKTTEAGIKERVVAGKWLSGMSADEFSAWLQSKPVDIFFQQLQRPPNVESQQLMQSMTEEAEEFEQRFKAWKTAPKLSVIVPLGYVLLPQHLGLEVTRLPEYFRCQHLWSDQHFTLYELGRR